jgi:O-antigen/teichoic acid export membrane protein
MGLFNAARQWNSIIIYLPGVFSALTLPVLSNLLGEGRKKQYNKMIVMNSIVLTGLAVLVALPVSLFSSQIMEAYGKEFGSGSSILLLVCAYSVLWAANIVIGQVLWSSGSSTLAMVLAVTRSFILIGSFMINPVKDAYGLALAYLITYALQTGYQGVLSVRCAKRLFHD